VNNGKVQFFPAVKVDETGGLNVAYYDNRSAAGDSMGVYLSRSTDGGTTWSDYPINQHWFRPAPASGGGSGNMGDNIGMTSGNGKLWPVWMDNSTGTLQVWTASIDIATIGIRKISSEVPIDFALHQNYPNPFNPTTKIKFDIPSRTTKAEIIIYDLLGRRISTLVNSPLEPGTYEATWDATSYPSGVYFCRLSAGTFTVTMRMVLTK
jgi:type IX secretion system substrate protein